MFAWILGCKGLDHQGLLTFSDMQPVLEVCVVTDFFRRIQLNKNEASDLEICVFLNIF